MVLDEVTQWRDFVAKDGTVFDLSFLNAKKVSYVHSATGKPDIIYDFFVTYSFHCFAKDYSHLSEEERAALAYKAPKETRPFCHLRYSLAKRNLCQIVENLSSPEYIITDAGYGSYITANIITEDGQKIWYHVPFKVYRERKKYRLHVLSAYPDKERHGGGKIGFFKIAYNLKMGKPLPSNPHK